MADCPLVSSLRWVKERTEKVNHDFTLPFTLKQLTTNQMCHTVKE